MNKLRRLAEFQQVWGVSMGSLQYRGAGRSGYCPIRSAGRPWRRLAELRSRPSFVTESVKWNPGEQPVMLRQAFDLVAKGYPV